MQERARLRKEWKASFIDFIETKERDDHVAMERFVLEFLKQIEHAQRVASARTGVSDAAHAASAAAAAAVAAAAPAARTVRVQGQDVPLAAVTPQHELRMSVDEYKAYGERTLALLNYAVTQWLSDEGKLNAPS